jgi:hypothetical protein
MSKLADKFKLETIEYLKNNKYVFEGNDVFIGEYEKDKNWIEIRLNNPINKIKSFLIFSWYKHVFRILDINGEDLEYNDYYERYICKLFDSRDEILKEITEILNTNLSIYISV